MPFAGPLGSSSRRMRGGSVSFSTPAAMENATDRFLGKLVDVAEPEAKRKIIGAEFIRVFEEEARKVGNEVSFLAQGTIYPDILESKDGVKAHHNVGGLPDDLQFELCEPVKLLYKDEVRVVGRELGLPENMVERQPFPGPGLGVRCLGASRLALPPKSPASAASATTSRPNPWARSSGSNFNSLNWENMFLIPVEFRVIELI